MTQFLFNMARFLFQMTCYFLKWPSLKKRSGHIKRNRVILISHFKKKPGHFKKKPGHLERNRVILKRNRGILKRNQVTLKSNNGHFIDV